MWVGMMTGAWPASHYVDIATCVPYVRTTDEKSDTSFHNCVNAGLKIVRLFHGCYSGSGVSGCGDPTGVANAALNWFTANTDPTTTPCIEIFNEPYGPWFWGSNASSSTNARAYTKYLKAFHDVFQAHYGSGRPLIAAAWESDSWGGVWQGATAANGGVDNPLQYVDLVTVHPYGGTSHNQASADGNRNAVSHAHASSGKPVLITEVGWPSPCCVTSDSAAWTLSEQATNITNFIAWAKGTGYVGGVMYYNDVDEASNRQYGVYTSGLSHKPGWTALKNAAAGTVTPPSPTAPTVVTTAPANVSTVGATLTGTVNPGLLSTVAVFDEGATTGYGNHITASPNPIPAGGNAVQVTATLPGPLTAGQTRHVKLSATNALGPGTGSDVPYVVPTGVAPQQIKGVLDPSDHSKMDISQIDPTVTQIRVAWTPLNTADNGLFQNFASPFPSSVSSPDPTKPWGNVSAYDGSGAQVGVWWDSAPGGARVQTTPGAGATSVVTQLNPLDPSQVQVVSVPPGTLLLEVGEAQDDQGTNLTFPGTGTDPGSPSSGFTAPFTLPLNFTPLPDHPAVKMLAYDAATYSGGAPSGNPLGSFSPYVVTTPSPSSPLPTVTTDDVSDLTSSGVTYHGHADTHGVAGGTATFQRVLIIDGEQTNLTALAAGALSNPSATLDWGAKQSNFVNAGTAVTVGSTGFTSGRFLLAVAEGKGVASTHANITPPTLADPWVPVTGGTLLFANSSGGAHKLQLFSRFAGASETSGIWKFDQVGNHIVTVHAIDGVDPTTSFEVQHADTGAKVNFQTSPSGLTAGIPPTIASEGELKVYGVAFPNGDTATFPTTTPTTSERDDIHTGTSALDVTVAVGTQKVTASGFSPTLTVTLDNSSGNGADVPAGFSLILRPVAGATSQTPSYVDTALDPGEYQVRLSVTAGGHTVVGDWVDFVIGGAAITSATVASITTTTAIASAFIDPLGTPASWRARISIDGVGWTDLGNDVSIGTTAQTVTQTITGLQPGRDYYVDFVVTQ